MELWLLVRRVMVEWGVRRAKRTTLDQRVDGLGPFRANKKNTYVLSHLWAENERKNSARGHKHSIATAGTMLHGNNAPLPQRQTQPPMIQRQHCNGCNRVSIPPTPPTPPAPPPPAQKLLHVMHPVASASHH